MLNGQHRARAIVILIKPPKIAKETAEETGNKKEIRKIPAYFEKLKAYPVAMQVYLDLQSRKKGSFSPTPLRRGKRPKWD
ncbi:hypothetical protein PH210_06180 [Paenibacillus sp. BSR1-1]|uniref:hypothetical protein n=1 Tax=Paenibacillus sp. BSR1-1 TaxID=3020845 RepID=UPI0025B2677B|nr:hypothetical protein [Paenibacillus sp. BSR1-1]MDN3015793.1 hypothetical protein [Paenibacillus sp. BSR1-1]